MLTDDLSDLARTCIAEAGKRNVKLTVAESCTGGLIAAYLTDVAGASHVFERGFVTYSNEAKQDLLGVPHTLIAAHGAVSTEVVRAMAEGALTNAQAHISVAVTGIAGPGGGSKAKPIGLVHIASARREGDTLAEKCRFGEIGRREVREKAVEKALQMLLKQITNFPD